MLWMGADVIKRIWRGWTSRVQANAYETLLVETIVPAITSRAITGLQTTEVLRRDEPERDEVEFMTIMTFDDWTAVEAFAGTDPTAAVVPETARRLLSRFDRRSAHYEHIA